MWSYLYRCSVTLTLPLMLIGTYGLAPSPLLAQIRSRPPQLTASNANPSRPIQQLGASSILPPPANATPESVTAATGTSMQPAAGLQGKTLDRLHHSLLRRDLRINGALSCATSNCHSGPRPGVLDLTASRSMEYQAWAENDPHARSWRTICGDESVAMMRRLGILEGDRIVDQKGFDNCLACHNSTQRFDEPRWQPTHSGGPANAFLREGVGCSACHGPSERWAHTHFQRNWTPESSEGFVAAGDLYVRARMCASCHVGDKDRDMNHDIIAAGHPSLRYEFATFHAWQPKHWRDAEADDKTAYEAQLWLAGQIAAADASLALLQTRAADRHTVSQWPEFASYDCASCHHNLGLQNRREPFGKQRRATALYSPWNDAGLRWLIDYRIQNDQASEEDHALREALAKVEAETQRRPRPRAESVSNSAQHARVALAKWFDGPPGQHERAAFRSNRLGKVVAQAAGKPQNFVSWESAVQFYLAAVAARESWPGGWDGPLRPLADEMQRSLRYPEMIDVSRYERRSQAKGPSATPTSTMNLAVQLGAFLGPIQIEPDAYQPPIDGESVQSDIERTLQQMRDAGRQRKDSERRPDAGDRPADTPAPQQPADPNDRQQAEPQKQDPFQDDPQPAPQRRRQSIEELRRSLEALQSGEESEP